MTLYKWSQTAATNASADSTINYAEGQAASSLNDSARAAMAAVAKYRDDHAGSLVTGGSSTAYTITSNQGFDTLAHLSGNSLKIKFHTANGASPTLNVDSLGAKALQTADGTAIGTGIIPTDSIWEVTYDNSIPAFIVHGTGGYQPLDATLTAIAGASTAADKLIYFSGEDTVSVTDFTDIGRTIAGADDAAAVRTALDLGTSATIDTGTSGTKIPLLNGDNTHSGANTFSNTAGIAAPNTIKAYGSFSVSGGTVSFTSGDAFKIASVTRNGTGDYTIAFSSSFADTKYVVAWFPVGRLYVSSATKSTGNIRVVFADVTNDGAKDPTFIDFAVLHP